MSGQMRHDIRNRTDPSRRGADASFLNDASRCRHPHKKLLEDGNTFRCEGCKRIVGFLRVPT
jgi:hypothetical protein